MKKRTFKTKLISVIAAAAMLAGTLPVFASGSNIISIDTKAENMDNRHNCWGDTTNEDFLVLKTNQGANPDEDKPWVEYYVYVEKTSYYDIEFKSSFIDDAVYTSNQTVAIDGEEINSLLSKGKIDETSKIDAVYSGTVNLDTGMHTIRFTMKQSVDKGGDLGKMNWFRLFYIKLKPVSSGTIVQDEKLIVDAAAIISGTHELTRFTEDTSGNSFDKLFNKDMHRTPEEYTASNISLKYIVTTPESGIYSMVVHGSSAEEYWGGCKVVIGNTEYSDVSFSDTDQYFNAGHCRVRKAQNVTLKKGDNVFYVKSNEKGKLNGNYGFTLDRIEFIPTGNLLVNADEGKGGDRKNVTGGKGGNIWYINGETQVWSYTLNVPAGEYNLYFGAGEGITNSWLGEMGFKIGDSDVVEVTNDNVTLNGNKYVLNCVDMKYNSPITLTDTETVKISRTAPAQNGTNNYIEFDYFELVPVNYTLSAEIKVAETMLQKGTETTASSKLYYDNGAVASDRLITSVAYSSSDSTVAAIDNDGKITANNSGNATITATYQGKDGQKYTAFENVIVYGEDGIIPVSVSYDTQTKTASVKLSTNSDTPTTASVILGGYKTENGATKFTDIHTESKSIERGRVATVSHTIDGDNIRAFIWDSLDGMKPVRDDIKIK